VLVNRRFRRWDHRTGAKTLRAGEPGLRENKGIGWNCQAFCTPRCPLPTLTACPSTMLGACVARVRGNDLADRTQMGLSRTCWTLIAPTRPHHKSDAIRCPGIEGHTALLLHTRRITPLARLMYERTVDAYSGRGRQGHGASTSGRTSDLSGRCLRVPPVPLGYSWCHRGATSWSHPLPTVRPRATPVYGTFLTHLIRWTGVGTRTKPSFSAISSACARFPGTRSRGPPA
jgi:hypothetical protein